MKGFSSGFAHLFAGFRLVLGVASIRKWAVIPVVINLALLIGMIVLAFFFTDDLLAWLGMNTAPSGFWKSVVYWLAYVGLVVLLIAASVLIMVLLSNVIAAPFYTKLAEATLRHLTGREFGQEGSFARLAAVSIYQEIVKLAIFIGIQAVLLAFHFIPVLGTLISITVSCFLLAFEFSDYSLEAYGHGVADRWRFVLANKPTMFGFGGGAFLLTLIPLANLFVAPAAVAGAARMVVELKGEKNVR